jgi:hypothetical protein
VMSDTRPLADLRPPKARIAVRECVPNVRRAANPHAEQTVDIFHEDATDLDSLHVSVMRPPRLAGLAFWRS